MTNDSGSALGLREVALPRASVSDRILGWTAAALSRAQRRMDAPWRKIGFTAAALALAFLSRVLADPVLPPGFPFLTFFPAVVLTTLIAGVRAGIGAAVVSAALAWYFFIPPFNTFDLTGGAGVALVFYAFVVGIDIVLITVMQRAVDRLSQEEQRSAALAEQRELLFKELQHRVANNLAMISGLLNVQRRIVEDQEAKQALAQAASRITLVGQIQRALHDPSRQRFELGEYLERLTRDLLEASGVKVAARVQCEMIEVPGDRAMLISLVAAELLTNAMKHGIGERPNGVLAVSLLRDADPEWAVLSVRDDGPGLSPQALERQSRSLGMQIVHNLARQLGAALDFRERQGTEAVLRFPIEKAPVGAFDAAA
jgi:two-component sensor histidine kinase